MLNIHTQFSLIASIASSKPTVNGGADGKSTAEDIATAQTALDAVASAFAALNA